MNTKYGGYAEVAVVEKQTTFRIPESLSFEEAATIPLAGNQPHNFPWTRLPVLSSNI
jgi:NADPH:quinone reductase-like Zn-dependent oxidoreductase